MRSLPACGLSEVEGWSPIPIYYVCCEGQQGDLACFCGLRWAKREELERWVDVADEARLAESVLTAKQWCVHDVQ